MEAWEKKLAEIMEMEDPRKAYIELAMLLHREHLPLTLGEEWIPQYMELHGIEDENEMAYYPNGERVLTPEMFW